MPPKAKKSASGLTKSQLVTELATKTGLTKKQVEDVYSTLSAVIQRELRSTGVITAIPGLLKIKKVDKPARAARMGRNPKTGEQIMISAKPASKSVRVTTLKSLKEMV
jgi:nucleoid DNA-binding protein